MACWIRKPEWNSFHSVQRVALSCLLLGMSPVAWADSPPGWAVTPTPSSHTLLLEGALPATFRGSPLGVGDYVGVFYDSAGTWACGGWVAWTGSNTALTAYGDDGETAMKEGFAQGEAFRWRVWRASDGAEGEATVTYQVGPPFSHDSTFANNGISGLASLSALSPPLSKGPNWAVTATPSSHTLLIPLAASPSYDGLPLAIGDYLGVYTQDTQGARVMAGKVRWEGQNTALTVYGDDAQSTKKDGYAMGEVFQWVLWRQADTTEYDMTATYQVGAPFSHTDSYADNGISGLTSLLALAPPVGLRLGYWSLDACDQTPVNQENGRRADTLLGATTVAGYHARGLQFDGIDDRLDLGTDSSLALGQAFSMAIWLKTSKTARQWVVGRTPKSGSFSWSLNIRNGSPELILGGYSAPGPYSAQSTITDGQWHHVVATLADSTVRLWVDGVNTQTYSAVAGVLNANADAPVWVGRRPDKADRQFAGILDELQIFNYALEPAAIQALSQAAATPEDCPQAAATKVAYFSLDSCAGLPLNEVSGKRAASLQEAIPVAGYAGQGLFFDGVNDYLSLGADSTLGFTDAFSAGLWVRTGSTATQWLMGRNRDGSSFSWSLRLHNGRPQVILGGMPAPGPYAASASIADDQWHHLGISFGGGTLKIFIDGVEDQSFTGLAGALNANLGKAVWVGMREDKPTSRQFSGVLDEIHLYDYAVPADTLQQLASLAFNPVGCTVPVAQQVGRYTFNACDPMPTNEVSGRPGVGLVGATYQYGYQIQGLSFDGVDDYVNLGTDSALAFTDAFTLSVWMKTTQTGSRFVLGRNRDGNNFSWFLRLSNGVPQMILGGLDVSGTYSAGVPINDGQWHHVVAQFAEETLTLWVDGVPEQVYNNLTGTLNANLGSEVWLGMRVDKPASRQYAGLLDELYLYDHALSTEAIVALSQAPFAPDICGASIKVLAGIWKLDDCTSAVAMDSLGRLNGVLNGPARSMGYHGAGLLFDGTNDYVDLGTDSVFELDTAFTVAMWINTQQQGNHKVLLAKNKRGGEFTYQTLLNGGFPSMVLGGGVAQAGPFQAPVQVADGQWHHVAWTLESETLRTYVDGQVVRTDVGISGSLLPAKGSSVWLGGRIDKTDRYYGGLMDEVRVYRTALLPAEIWSMANRAATSEGCSSSGNTVENIFARIVAAPNPSDDWVSLQVAPKFPAEPYQVVIWDSMGRSIHSSAELGQKSLTLQLRSWGSGWYYVQVISARGKQTERIYIRP